MLRILRSIPILTLAMAGAATASQPPASQTAAPSEPATSAASPVTPKTARTRRRRAPVPDPEKEALRKKLADATGKIGELDSRVLDLTAQVASLQQKVEADAAAASEAQQKLDTANQSAASLEARLNKAEESLKKITADYGKLQRATAQPAPRTPSPQEVRLVGQLQDITRRRDSLIATILHRYKELANDHRAFGAVLTAPNEREAAVNNSPESSRIQNAIAMAEEDMRQLNGLEAQAALVRKQLAKLRTP